MMLITAIHCLTLLLLFLVCSLAIATSKPLYDCIDDRHQHHICEWSSSRLQSVLIDAVSSSSHGSVASPTLIALFDRLKEEDVDGNVWLSLEKEEFEMLININKEVSEADKLATLNAAIKLRQSIFDQEQQQQIPLQQQHQHVPSPSPSPSTPPIDARQSEAAPQPSMVPEQCDDMIQDLSRDTRAILQLLAETYDAASSSSRPSPLHYTGKWAAAPLKRMFPPLLSTHQPRLSVLYGEHDVDLSNIIYSFVPDAIILQITERMKGDSLDKVKDKLKKRQQAMSASPIQKRGKSANIIVNLPMHSALCILNAAALIPDFLWLSPWYVPVASPSADKLSTSCKCHWWSHPYMIIGGYAPAYPALHQLALLTNHRIYSDQPIFVLSKPQLAIKCYDNLGHQPIYNQALLGLYMIVKNEIGGMRDTMNSLLPYVDRVSVLDTGSTDGTPELITEMLVQYGVIGVVYHGPFIDFSTTRNLALRYATEQNTTFILMLNGDDTLINGDDIRPFLSSRQHMCGPSDEMYLVSIDYEGHKISWSERFMRTSNHQFHDWPHPDKHWHYTGLTHESYTHIPYANGSLGEFSMTYAGRSIPGAPDDGYRFHIYHTYVRDTPEKLHARAAKDVQLLMKQLETLPNDPRTLYYISHSYDVQQDYPNALIYHLKRVATVVDKYLNNRDKLIPVIGDKEECTCLLRIGKIEAYRLTKEYTWTDAEYWLKLATVLCDDQIESRYYLAEHAWINSDVETAWRYISEAHTLLVSQKGLAHILESDTVHERVPLLHKTVKQYREEQKQEKKQKKQSISTATASEDAIGAESKKSKSTKQHKKKASNPKGSASKREEL